ncbi:hypothetical protein Tco_1033741 [Tanacetum coccineum]
MGKKVFGGGKCGGRGGEVAKTSSLGSNVVDNGGGVMSGGMTIGDETCRMSGVCGGGSVGVAGGELGFSDFCEEEDGE